MDFEQAEKSFKQIKAQFVSGTLNESDFKTRLEELMVQDDQGGWWMIGYETERWYRYDGTNWVQAVPPGTINKDLLEKEKEASELHYRGMLAQKQGNYEEAERLFRQSLAIAVDLKDEQGKANILQQLAILTQERLDTEKRQRENVEKAARAQVEREAAEKAAREKAKQEAADRAAREKSEREAAEKASREKAEREASFRTIFEETEPKVAERIAHEKADHKTSKKPPEVIKQNAEKLVMDKDFFFQHLGECY